MEQKLIPQIAFREANDIGVVWVMDEAIRHGFYSGNEDWANFGQGEPEVGELKGGTPRINEFLIEPDDNHYGPTNGTDALRKTIANHYNHLYRDGKTSKYSAENVSIAMGGRLALSRIFTSLGAIRLGYKVPEYPAYHDMLNYQLDRITPICVPSKKETNYAIPSSDFAASIKKYKLDAFLFSNPCNPSGHVIKGEELNQYVTTSREQNCALIIDEFYSHFIYKNNKPAVAPVSSAHYIDDVNTDPVLIVDGLTKSFRYPGWRLAWVIGPKNTIEIIGKTASAVDGGPSAPIQRAALQLFDPKKAEQEAQALRQIFSHKQNLMLHALRKNGIICSEDSHSTFYVWADISQLPAPLNNSHSFFIEALKYKVICVPGYMFDIHPGKQKKRTNFDQHIRFSFGPEEASLKMGLKRITELIQSHK